MYINDLIKPINQLIKDDRKSSTSSNEANSKMTRFLIRNFKSLKY